MTMTETNDLAAFTAAMDAELARCTVTDEDLERLAALPQDAPPPAWAFAVLADLAFRSAASFACEVASLLVEQPVALDGGLLFRLCSWPIVRAAITVWERHGRDGRRVRLVVGAGVEVVGPRAPAEGLVLGLGPVIARMQQQGTWPGTAEDSGLVTAAEARRLLGAEAEGLTDEDVRRLRDCAERLAGWTVGEFRRRGGAGADGDLAELHSGRVALRQRAH